MKMKIYRIFLKRNKDGVIENLEMVKKYCNVRNIERKDNFGYTPLELANLIKNDRILRVLKENI